MEEKRRFSRRTFLTAAAIAVPVAGIAIAVPNAFTRQPDIAMWWSSLTQNGDTPRATLTVRIPAGLPGGDEATIFLNAMTHPVYSLAMVSLNEPWAPFFSRKAPFQLLTAARNTAERTAVAVVDFAKLSSDSATGSVRASCAGSDGRVLAVATLNLAEPLFTKFS